MADPVAALERKRRALNLTQEQFGARYGLSQATMSRILTRRSVPPFDLQRLFEKEDGVKVEWWPDQRAEYLRAKRRRAG